MKKLIYNLTLASVCIDSQQNQTSKVDKRSGKKVDPNNLTRLQKSIIDYNRRHRIRDTQPDGYFSHFIKYLYSTVWLT